MNIPMAIMGAFVVYRIARMLAIEEGPFSLFSRLRGLIDPEQRTWLGRGVNCPLCISFWLALPVTLSLSYWSWWVLFHWLAIAGIAAWLQKVEQ